MVSGDQIPLIPVGFYGEPRSQKFKKCEQESAVEGEKKTRLPVADVRLEFFADHRRFLESPISRGAHNFATLDFRVGCGALEMSQAGGSLEYSGDGVTIGMTFGPFTGKVPESAFFKNREVCGSHRGSPHQGHYRSLRSPPVGAGFERDGRVAERAPV
jgi:hypothetical protein